MMKNDDHPVFGPAQGLDPRARAYLIWKDQESGEELSIEVIGSREFLEDLVGEGFAVEDEHSPRVLSGRCRIVAGQDESA